MARTIPKILARYGQGCNAIRVEWIDVTPKIAAAWIEKSKRNRRISQEHVDRLASEMRAGLYQTTHQVIAFDCDDVLIDGHHKLWAILLSGATVRMLVAKNLRREAVRVIDTGRSRTLQDRLTMDGTWGSVSRSEAACLRRMLRADRKTHRMSPTEEHESWRKHHGAVRFAITAIPALGTAIRTTAVRAAVAASFTEARRGLLLEFALSLRSKPDVELGGLTDANTFTTTSRLICKFVDGRP